MMNQRFANSSLLPVYADVSLEILMFNPVSMGIYADNGCRVARWQRARLLVNHTRDYAGRR